MQPTTTQCRMAESIVNERTIFHSKKSGGCNQEHTSTSAVNNTHGRHKNIIALTKVQSTDGRGRGYRNAFTERSTVFDFQSTAFDRQIMEGNVAALTKYDSYRPPRATNDSRHALSGALDSYSLLPHEVQCAVQEMVAGIEEEGGAVSNSSVEGICQCLSLIHI